jgi:hypothetical protein
MFINYLKFKMSIEFIELVKLFQETINKMNITACPNWMENYSKSIILFEGQSKGHSDKYQTIQDLNDLYNGFIALNSGKLPEISIRDLTIFTNYKGKQIIGLIIDSNNIIDMRADLSYTFGYKIYSEENIIIKKFKSTDGSENIIIEPLCCFFPIISESHIKKGINIKEIYCELIAALTIHSISGKILKPTELVYETENKRGKKIKVW